MKGFGFINADDNPDVDIFAHYKGESQEAAGRAAEAAVNKFMGW